MEDNKQIELTGIHGTCRSSADSIIKNGFRPGKGRHGTGVYVWSSNKEDHSYAIELAMCYANDRSQEKNPTTVALMCNILTTKDNLLDVEQDSTSRMLTEFIRKNTNYLATAKNYQRKIRAAKVADDFVRLLEESTGLSFDIIHTKTQAPQSYRNKLSIAEKFLNMEKQGCYIVRNLNCIVQDKIKAA